jgi:hypothetical protein
MVGIMCSSSPYSLAIQQIFNDNIKVFRKGFISNLYRRSWSVYL